MAQTPSDPSSGSPAGTVYELPVDKGRNDAAPGGKGGGGNGGGTESGPLGNGSLYRSENNFGTSGRVPGAPPKLRDKADTDEEVAILEAAKSEPSSSSGSSGGVTSESGAVVLLALLAAGGIGVGFFSRRSWA